MICRKTAWVVGLAEFAKIIILAEIAEIAKKTIILAEIAKVAKKTIVLAEIAKVAKKNDAIAEVGAGAPVVYGVSGLQSIVMADPIHGFLCDLGDLCENNGFCDLCESKNL